LSRPRRAVRARRPRAARMTAAAQPRGLAFDPLLVCAMIALAALGAVMVGSASITIADQKSGEPFYFLVRHLAALAIGGGALAIPSELWPRVHWLLLVGAFGLLVAVLLPGVGRTVNGATRWIDLGPLDFQASEPARLCLLLYVASYAVRRGEELAASLKGLV